MTRPLDLANDLAELVNPQPQADLDPEAAGLGDDGLLVPDLDPQLEALLGDGGAAGRMRGVAADIALDDGAYRGRLSSRAALFGEPDFEEGSSEGGGSDSEQQDEERGRPQFTSPSRLRTVAVSPERDISRYKTMFVNGHHKPGDAVTEHSTDSSSSDGDEGSDSDREQQDGQQQQQQQQEEQDMNGHDYLQDTVQQQQQVGTSGVVHLQQQRHQSPPAALWGAVAMLQQEQQQQQQQQQPEALPSHSHPEGQAAGDAHLAAGAGVEDEEMADEQSGDDTSGDESDGEQGAAGSSSEEGSQDEGDEHEGTAAAAAAHDAADDGDAAGGSVADRVAAAAAAAAMLGEAAEMQELEREAAAVRAEGEQQLLAAAAGGDRQAAKAAGVRAQQRLWGNALELRIRLQQAVNGANRLPRPAAAAVLQSSNSQVAASYQQLRAACQETLESMLQLHDALAQQHPAAAAVLEAAGATQQQQQQPQATAAAAGSKRSRAAAGLEGEEGTAKAGRTYTGVCSGAAAAWAAVDGAIDSMAGFRDASLDKWHRRTVLSSGTAALRGSSGLRALQQSISSQVSQLMSADRAKLIARSQLPVQLAPRPLGQPAAAADSQQQQEQQDGDDASAAAVRGGDRARDPETYDEGDFYSQLLKQLLEAAPAGSVPAQLASARPAKRRKVVDRRASKGRKLRFHTMDKLVGFMAPRELILPPFAEQLFGNLFSHEG